MQCTSNFHLGRSRGVAGRLNGQAEAGQLVGRDLGDPEGGFVRAARIAGADIAVGRAAADAVPQINVEAQAAETGGAVASRRGAQQVGAVCVQPGGSAADAGQIWHEPDVQLVIAGQVYAAQIQRQFAAGLRGRHVQQFDNGLGVLQGLQRRVDLVTVVIEFLH